ncbi:hydrolase [Microdochium trichocladiopsis]|uniref:Hydrolase n=1 Tax=Microdochium trichocladiopsis TaxID=1682393 RepID=A0A9P8XXT6_9PEZI|nr:hydrolase [Microdochium trichocladiopsis]KAH7024796.1 hydrolase [Microdochium trichocladiopsis]
MPGVTTQVAVKRISEPKVGENGYTGFHPGKVDVFKAGSQPFGADTKALTSDIQLEHDIEIVVRDGARLYADVYRPHNWDGGKIPAILSWSPYGKKYSALDMLPMTIWHSCVRRDDLSGLEKFEGLDPAHWCPRGYAIVSVDARGAGNSDGHIGVLGTQEGEDGHDVVEAIAAMDWCNGNVGMAGNSYLAISQWFTAAQAPPSLKAIAPWEGLSDLYREQFCRGGRFSMDNFDLITKEILRGKPSSGVEDIAEMYRRSPVINDFWRDKRADFTKIKCPVYIKGSDVSGLHNMGSIRAWLEIPHDQKWIQWGAEQEWFDLYSIPQSNVDLAQYFDHYLQGKDTKWVEQTPKVRWTTLQYGDRKPTHDIKLAGFPVPNTEYKELFFAPDSRLAESAPAGPAQRVSYNSEQKGSCVEFTHTFPTASRLLGLPKAILYMSCDARDDFVVYVHLRKKDKDGKDLLHLNFPIERTPIKSISELETKNMHAVNTHSGQQGILRASHRRIDREKSIHPQFPFHPHEKQEKIEPGTVVKLEIGIWAMGVDYEAGESITVRQKIGGHNFTAAEFTAWSLPRPDHELNKGEHKVYFGGEYPSSIILPYVGAP